MHSGDFSQSEMHVYVDCNAHQDVELCYQYGTYCGWFLHCFTVEWCIALNCLCHLLCQSKRKKSVLNLILQCTIGLDF